MKNQLTVLGSGISVSSFFHKFDFRNPSGHLLQYDGHNILLDCGEGMRGQMDKIKFDYFDLNAIFISHFHPDHFNFDSLIQSLFVRAHFYAKKEKRIKIFGPPKIQEIMINNFNNKHLPQKDYWNSIVSQHLKVEFHEYKDQEKITLAENVIMTPFAVKHTGLDAYAMRFEVGDKVIAYSGDSGDCEGLYRAAQNADLFVCEAALNNGDPENFKVHVSPKKAGEVAKKAGVKQLILVHYTGHDSAEEMIQAVKASHFEGEVSVASDLDSYQI